MISFNSPKDYAAKSNSIAGIINISDFLKAQNKESLELKDAWINIGGWQSWNPGYEIEPGVKQPWLNCHLVKPFNKYLNFPGSKNRISKNIVLSPFFTYFRWNDGENNFFVVLVSSGNLENSLPPVQFVINRNENTVQIELCDTDKKWKKDELMAQIEIFSAGTYFEAREKLEKIFGSSDPSSPLYSKRFEQIKHLGKTAFGWESWYNHYANINEQLILEDLSSLKSTKNIINLCQDAENVVFQIDDGWEQALGDWDYRTDRFPKGLKPLTEKIETEGYIPGLWLAPFIIDLRSKTAQEHPDWLLRNKKGNLVSAGFNFLWGATGTYYCLDLSNKEVVNHIDSILDKVINQWGFRYIKLDFLFAGVLCGNHLNKGAAYEWYTKAVKVITSRRLTADGKKVCYLGCGAPFELSYNDFPLSRIGCDTYEHWDNSLPRNLKFFGRNSAYLNLKDTIGHAMWDKIIFANDPDVLFIRKENCSLTKDEKILLAATDTMFGSQLMYSDDPAKSCSEEEIKLAKEIADTRKKLLGKEIQIYNTGKDSYIFESKNKDVKGTICFDSDMKAKDGRHKINFSNL